MTENEWQTRKERIDKKLKALSSFGVDGPVKSRRNPNFVIPVKTGIPYV
jgi:hypothetical protein